MATNSDSPPYLPTGFAIIQSLSVCVLRHWPPSTALQGSLAEDGAWNGPYDAALVALRNMQEDITLSLRKAAFGILSARNYASPVQTLPPEVLRQVFMDLNGDMRTKLALTQTCSAWRELMLDDPFMWTSVDLDTIHSSVIASKVFRRAKEYPLQLSCDNWNELRLNCAAFELARVEELNTTFTVPMFRNLCKRPAPMLKRFRIAIPRHSNMITYLPYLFAQTHPVLTDLTMIDCRLMFTADNYRGLKKLDIRFSRPMMSLRQDEDFLYIFRGCPGLEEIRLENMNLYRDLPQNAEIIHLAQLQTMHLRLSLRDMNCLLSALSAPPSLRLSMITYGYDRRRGTDVTDPVQPCLRLVMRTKHLHADNVTNTIFAFDEVDGTSPSFCRKVIQSEEITPSSAASDVLVRLIETYAMPHLLKIRTRNIEPAALVCLLQRCPTVTTLEIISTDAGIGDTATIPALTDALYSSETPLLPNLQSLTLERVYMDVETLFQLVELRRSCSDLQVIHLHLCRGDLPPEEMITILEGEFRTADWSSRSVVVDGMPCNDLESAP